jgi:hypothetical protein
MNDHVIYKDRAGARIAPEPKPKPLPSRTYLPGSVDLAHAASLPEWAAQPARIMDVAFTVDAASDAVIEAAVEFVNKKLAAQTARLENRFTDLSSRSALIELDCANLRATNAELRRDIAVLNARLDVDQAQRAQRRPKPVKAAAKADAHELPAALLRKIETIKRKRASGVSAVAPPP